MYTASERKGTQTKQWLHFRGLLPRRVAGATSVDLGLSTIGGGGIFKVILLMVGTIFMQSCLSNSMTLSEVHKLMERESSGLKKTATFPNGLKMEVYLFPRQLLGPGLEQKDSLQASQYFLLSFSKDGTEALHSLAGTNHYYPALENLSFKAEDFCRLVVDKKDTVRLSNSHFTNLYGTGAANELILVFDAKTPKSQYELEIDELGLNAGNTQFTFSKWVVERVNQIKITN